MNHYTLTGFVNNISRLCPSKSLISVKLHQPRLLMRDEEEESERERGLGKGKPLSRFKLFVK